MIYLLMLAMLILPWQALYAQTEMMAPAQKHDCHHAQQQQAEHMQHDMACCEDTSHCNSNCLECYHCQSISAVVSVLNLVLQEPYSGYSLPLHETSSGLAPAPQYRPPRTLV